MDNLFPDLLSPPAAIKRSVLEVPHEEIMAAWNKMAAENGLPTAMVWDASRKRLATARWKDPVFVTRWQEAINAVPLNEHWMGKNGWRGTLTSFLRPGKYITILENARSPQPEMSAEDQQREADAIHAHSLHERT